MTLQLISLLLAWRLQVAAGKDKAKGLYNVPKKK